jgi:hypothetical protein
MPATDRSGRRIIIGAVTPKRASGSCRRNGGSAPPLAGVGAGYEHVVCVRIFLTDFERDYAALNRIYTEYFEPGRLPARTTVGVTHLARGGIVEVDLIARRS